MSSLGRVQRRRRSTLLDAARLHQLALEAENRSDSTKKWYRNVIDRYVEFMEQNGHANKPIPLSTITTDSARGFVLWLRARTSTNPLSGSIVRPGPVTIRDYASGLKSFVKFCVNEDLLPSNPLTRFRLPVAPSRVVEPYTADDLRAMLRVIDRHGMAVRNRAILYLLVTTGMRASELCGLKISDVEPLSGRKAKLMGKGKKERWVYFDRATQRALAAVRNSATSSQLFTTRDGRPLHYRALYKLVHDWGEEAGITRPHPHRFRHTFAIAYLRAHPGALFHLQQLLGHSSLEMVRRYSRLAEAETPLDGPSPLEQMGIR